MKQDITNQAAAGTAASGRPRVLLAEDDDEMRRLIAETLRRDGYHVMEAPTGRDLMAVVAGLQDREGPGRVADVIISDIRMPGMDGLELLKELRMRKLTMPIILITAFGDEETHRRAEELGATAIFDKPFDLDDLLTVLANTPILGRLQRMAG
jgi:CheY-like chemotaxis protein